MIAYSPIDGDIRHDPIDWCPKTAFIMQQLGKPIPSNVVTVRNQVDKAFEKGGFRTVDASKVTTGRDFLSKIWNMILGCPVGVAIVHEEIKPSTLANIYFELGMFQAYGRETIVVKVGNPNLPSDLLRTEYVEAGRGFTKRFRPFVEDALAKRAEYYRTIAEKVEKNPLLAIDYLRRSALLTGDTSLNVRAREILDGCGIGERARASVERMMVEF